MKEGMTMRSGIAALALVTGITIFASAARADDVTHQCVSDARATKQACVQVCNGDFLASIDSCRGVNHDCADAARANRETCVSDVLTALSDCVTQMCSSFDTVIAGCRQQFPPTMQPERDQCVDGAQLQKFQCRDQCRENVKLFSSLKACRDEFKADIAQCPAAPKPPPPAPQPMG
jgi:hypothetical protein